MNLHINAVNRIDFLWNVSTNNVTTYFQRDVRNNLPSTKQKEEGRCCINSHVDTSCIGKRVRIMEVIKGKSCDVYPFNKGYYTPMKKIPLKNGMFSTHTVLGETIVLNALDITDTMNHSFSCTNKSRENGV